MSTDSLMERLSRIYASLDEALEGDLAKFPPKIVKGEPFVSIYQDFLGGLTQAQISNIAHSFVHNIANFKDHLKKWVRSNNYDVDNIDNVFKASRTLKIMQDLSDNDKHGYPKRNGGYSKKSPHLIEVKRVMRLVGGGSGHSGIYLTPKGPKKFGDGSANVIITGQVVDGDNNSLGNLYDISIDAVVVWEQMLKSMGILS